jgi:HSP20 family protein
MSMLLRFDPFRELDRMFEQTTDQFRRPSMPMDAYRHGDTFVIHFDLPGVDPASIDLELERNVLTVGAERSWRPVEGDDVVAAERRHGQFRRQLLVGDGLDAEKMHASFEHGVLTVTIPVAEKSKPRKINVATNAAGPEAIEATAT